MQFLKVWGKNKRFLKNLNFFFTRGPPGGILKIFASFLLGVYWQCRTCTMKAIKGSWLLESHTQKIRKIAHTGAKLESFLWGRGPKIFFGPPNFSKFLPIFHLQIALAQKPYLHFHFRFFPKIPRSICLTWPKNSEKSLFFDFYFFWRIYRSVYRPTAANGLRLSLFPLVSPIHHNHQSAKTNILFLFE